MAKGFFFGIEGTGNIIRIFRFDYFQHLIYKTKECAGMKSITGNEWISNQPKMSAIKKCISIQYKKAFPVCFIGRHKQKNYGTLLSCTTHILYKKKPRPSTNSGLGAF
jgi:hypothetical protein